MVDDDYDDDEALLESVDPSNLRGLCETHSLPSHGTKAEMLARLRGYAEERAMVDRLRGGGEGEAGRIEPRGEGPAHHHR